MLLAMKFLGAIALLVFGMKTTSEALQKMAGPQLRHLFAAMTGNRFFGVAVGALITVAVQSSSATTVMTVSFVNASLLTLTQAISVIMGANIGTTLTAWILSAGFSFDVVNVVWAAFFAGVVLIQLGRKRYLGDFLFGLGFLLYAMILLKTAGVEMDLANRPGVVEFLSGFETGYATILLFLLVGAVLTAVLQSSAALMAITMVLCATGAVSVYQAVALVMGENIGTTSTANLAALNASAQARRTAMAHLLFNAFGVVWMLAVFFPFVRAVCGVAGIDPGAPGQDPARLSFALAAFHTGFNVVNTAVLIWFVPQIERIVCWAIRPGKSDEEDEFRLRYIRRGIMKTPEISVLQAQKEIVVFGEKTLRMFSLVRELYDAKDERTFARLYDRIEKGEEGSDRMENEIGRYLGDLGAAHLSDDTKEKVRAMLRQIKELESVGDSCFNLARILRRGRNGGIEFVGEQDEGVRRMFSLVHEALERMNVLLSGRREDLGLAVSEEIEGRINACRDELKRRNIESLDARLYDYDNGTVFADLVGECEKTGDYVLNVVEARLGAVRNGIRCLGIQIDVDAKKVTVDGAEVPFTKTEYELLKFLMENRGEVFSRERLLSAVWPDVVVTPRTVDVNVARIRKKIGAYAGAIASRPGFGYSFQERLLPAPDR